MSGTQEWRWQGFFGPMALTTGAKLGTDKSAIAGAWLPEKGKPPMPVDTQGTMGMFAVMVPVGSSISTPVGLMQADPAIVGRLVGG